MRRKWAGGLPLVAAVLLLGVGCFNREHGSAEAASVGSPSNSEAAQSAASSAGKTAALRTTWSHTHLEPVEDPGLHQTAFTVTVPDGWKYVGMILRPKGCHAPAVPADGLSWTVLSPDGISAIGQMPGSKWMWQSDGVSPMGPGCAPIDIATGNAFLLNIAVPNARPNATNIQIQTLTDNEQKILAQARENDANAPPQYGVRIKHLVDFGRVRFEYTENGRLIDEQLGVVLTCDESAQPAMPLLRRPATTRRNCNTHGTYFARAPHGHLQELLNGKLPIPQIDHQWDMRISQQMQQAFAQMQAASDAQFRANQQHFQDQTKQMLANGRAFQAQMQRSTDSSMAAAAASQNAVDHAAQMQMRDSLNRQDFIDPNTGRRIETSNQYTHNWVGSDGTVVLNSDPTFDPNGTINPVRESFTELIPIN